MFYKMHGFNMDLTEEKEIFDSPNTVKLDIRDLESGIKSCLHLDMDGNLLINGVTRYGKSVFTEAVANSVETAGYVDRRVYFDIKNDYIKCFYKQGDKVVSFRDNLGHFDYFKWNLVKEIRLSSDPDMEIKEIANMLIADKINGGQSDFFYKAAAKVFGGYMAAIIHCYSNNPNNKMVITNLKTMPFAKIKADLMKWPDNINIVRDYLGEDDTNRMSKMTQSIMACFSELIDLFGGNFCDEGEDTIADYISGSYGERLFLEYDYNRKESSNAFFRFFLNKLIKYKLSQNTDRNQKMMLFMDEISVLNGDFGLMDAVTIGAGNGLQVIVVTQSLEKLYCIAPQLNNEHITNASQAGFASFITFHPGDTESIKKMIDIFGEEEFERVTFGLSRYQNPTSEIIRQNKVTSDKFTRLGIGEFYAKVKGDELVHGKLII